MALNIIRFGIPSLDRLLGRPVPQKGAGADYGIALDGQSTTICIVGTDGTGKSVLALHLASRCIADAYGSNKDGPTNAWYISTELGYPKASTMWQRYQLHRPNARINPLEPPGSRQHPGSGDLAVPPRESAVTGKGDGSESGGMLPGINPGRHVTFFDLTGAAKGSATSIASPTSSATPGTRRHSRWIHAQSGTGCLATAATGG